MVCFFLGIYSYICDITTEDERSRRLALVDAFFPIAVYIGMELSTFLVGSLGIAVTFLVGMALAASAMIYNVALLKDSRVLRRERLEKVDAMEEEEDQKSSDRGMRALGRHVQCTYDEVCTIFGFLGTPLCLQSETD